MAHANKVLRSIETDEGGRCVDIFVRPDGTFGFEEFRRDVEDGCGWFPIGVHGDGVYGSEDAALEQALATVAWLKGVLGPA